MRRTSLILAGAVACLVLAFAASAAAMPTENENPPTKLCTTSSKNVVGHTFKTKIVANNVDPSQAKYGSCAYAKKVADGLTSLRIEEPKVVKGFRCTPRVLSTEPDVVKYACLFRGADTATEIRVTFKVKYDLD
jgi:hypothetical protein